MERRAAGWWTYMRGFCPCCEVFRGAYRVEIKFNLLLLKIKKTCCVVARTKNLKKEQIFVHPVRTYTFRGRGREGRLLLLFGIARVIRGSIGFVCTHLLTVYKSITRVKSARFPSGGCRIGGNSHSEDVVSPPEGRGDKVVSSPPTRDR